jgi:flagellar hook protein FlgE
MAISGNGFFVTQGTNGAQDFTRAGDFTTNKDGQLITPSGQLLLGYPAVNGVVNNSASMQPLQVGSMTSPAVPSTTVGITANLDSDTAVGGTATSSTVDVFDSLGTSHTLTVNYTMTATGTWNYTVTVPSADVVAGTAGDTTVGSGTLNFNGSGQLTCRWRHAALDTHWALWDGRQSDHHPDRAGKRHQRHNHGWIRPRHALDLRGAAGWHH